MSPSWKLAASSLPVTWAVTCTVAGDTTVPMVFWVTVTSRRLAMATFTGGGGGGFALGREQAGQEIPGQQQDRAEPPGRTECNGPWPQPLQASGQLLWNRIGDAESLV